MKVSEVELAHEAENFARTLTRAKEATIIGLSGDLGAGKTTFTKALAKALGVDVAVTSPTFVIQKIYRLENQEFRNLIHIDAYRLNSAHELSVLGFEEIAKDPENLIVIEWPERVSDILPEIIKKISLQVLDEESRELNYA